MSERQRVVLVEDLLDIRALVHFTLRHDCDIVGETDSAEDAIDLVALSQPDVIVLDNILAGELTGLDVAPSLKAASPRSRVVLFSATVVEPDTMPAGVDAVVPKTSRLGDLRDEVVQPVITLD